MIFPVPRVDRNEPIFAVGVTLLLLLLVAAAFLSR